MPEAQIVWTVDEELPLTTFETTPFKLARKGESLKVEVNLVVEVESNFRKRAYVKPNLPNYQTFVVCSDEAHIPSKNNYEGEGSAPPPLSYFAAGAAFCLMSHLKGYFHERKIEVRSYKVEQRLKFTRGLPEDVENSGKPGASCDLLETHVVIDSDEAPDVIRSCIEDAQAVCMATVALINPVPAVTYIQLNGEEI